MNHMFSDLSKFRREPLGLLSARGNAADTPLQHLYLGPSPVYLVTDPALIKPILKMDERLVGKGRLVRKLESVLGPSSLTINGQDHCARRAVFHQIMARGNLESRVEDLCSEIRRQAAKLARKNRFRADEFCRPLALNLICVILFGRKILSNSDQAALIESVLIAEQEVCRAMFRMLPDWPWTQARRRRNKKKSVSTFSAIVQKARQQAQYSPAVSGLQELDLDDAALSHELLTMLVVGHHTAGGAAAWLLYHLAAEPGLAEQISAEAQMASDEDGNIRPCLLPRLKISLALVREVLRLYPTSWWFSREVEQSIEIAGQRLNPGTTLMFSQWHLHRDPRFWDDPDIFNLKRDFGTPAYIPFGAGPRACIGLGAAMLELQLIALEFASAFQLETISRNPLPGPTASITLLPPAIELKIAPRGSQTRALENAA